MESSIIWVVGVVMVLLSLIFEFKQEDKIRNIKEKFKEKNVVPEMFWGTGFKNSVDNKSVAIAIEKDKMAFLIDEQVSFIKLEDIISITHAKENNGNILIIKHKNNNGDNASMILKWAMFESGLKTVIVKMDKEITKKKCQLETSTEEIKTIDEAIENFQVTKGILAKNIWKLDSLIKNIWKLDYSYAVISDKTQNRSFIIEFHKKEKRYIIKEVVEFITGQVFWVKMQPISTIIFNKDNTKFVMLKHNVKMYTYEDVINVKTYTYEDVIEVEILEQTKNVSKSITKIKTNRGSQIASALVGGVLFGGAGAIVGGLSGKKSAETMQEKSNKILYYTLKLIVNDAEFPIYTANFTELREAEQWHALFTRMIYKADREAKSADLNPNNASVPLMIADELIKLTKLRNDGEITVDEYEQLKTVLISRTT